MGGIFVQGPSKEFDPLLHVVPLPEGQAVELVLAHPERQLKVRVRQVLLQVAPVEVLRELIVGGEEGVERVGLVLPGEGGRGVGPHGEEGPGEALAVGAGGAKLGVVRSENVSFMVCVFL